METSGHQKEDIKFNGYNGWYAFGLNMVILFIMLIMFGVGGFLSTTFDTAGMATCFAIGAICFVVSMFISKGFFVVGINECAIIELCSKYKGTCYETGYRWLPFWYNNFNFSLKVRNFETEITTCNDAYGTPVQMQVVVVYQVRDAGMAKYNVQDVNSFVRTQSEAAVRQVVGMYPYEAHKEDPITLRGSSNFISQALTNEIQKQCSRIGVMIIESRIAFLAYSPDIAATMLRRQQVGAVVSARGQIVDGAVSMVEMALAKLSTYAIVGEFDAETKADMVSRLVVVLCGDEKTQPVMTV